MKSLRLLILAFGIITLASTPSLANETPPEIELVQNFYDELVVTMKKGPELGFEGRYKKLAPIIEKTFNLPLMARYSVGRTWRKTPKEKQDKLIKAFTAFSVATYASRFTKFDGEVFKVLGITPSANGTAIVGTTLTPNGGEPVTLNYLIRKDRKGQPRISDVYLGATISELATRRADFTSVIKKDGFDKLIASLQEKAKKMGEPKVTQKPEEKTVTKQMNINK